MSMGHAVFGSGPLQKPRSQGVVNTASNDPLHNQGRIEVVRLIKELPPLAGFTRAKNELIYLAKPTNGQAAVNRVHIVGTEADSISLLHPDLDVNAGRLRLFQPLAEFERVRRLLRENRERYCYIWRSSDLLKARAWLFTPH